MFVWRHLGLCLGIAGSTAFALSVEQRDSLVIAAIGDSISPGDELYGLGKKA